MIFNWFIGEIEYYGFVEVYCLYFDKGFVYDDRFEFL